VDKKAVQADNRPHEPGTGKPRFLDIDSVLKYLGLFVSLSGIVGLLVSVGILTITAKVSFTLSGVRVVPYYHFRQLLHQQDSRTSSMLHKYVGASFAPETAKMIRFDTRSPDYPAFRNADLERQAQQLRTWALGDKDVLDLRDKITLDIPRVPSIQMLHKSLKEIYPVDILSYWFTLNRDASGLITIPSEYKTYEDIWRERIIPFVEQNFNTMQRLSVYRAFVQARKYATLITIKNDSSVEATNVRLYVSQSFIKDDEEAGIISCKQLHAGPAPTEEHGRFGFSIPIIRSGHVKQILVWSNRANLKADNIELVFDSKPELRKSTVVVGFSAIIVIFTFILVANIRKHGRPEVVANTDSSVVGRDEDAHK